MQQTKKVTVKDLQEIRDRGWGHVRDLNKSNTLTVRWNLEKEGLGQKTVSLIVGGKETFVDVEELRKLLRWA